MTLQLHDKKTVAALSAVLIIALSLSFWAGTSYGKNKSRATNQNRFGQMMNNQTGGRTTARSGMGGFIGGEVISFDGTTLTLKMQNGSSKIVFLGDSTMVSKSVDGSKSDLVAGKFITITGKTNSDGSVTAQSIQIQAKAPAMIQPETTPKASGGQTTAGQIPPQREMPAPLQ